jgi:hypothetical protein
MQLQRTVMRHRVRAASAALHYALATRMIRWRAAAELHVSQTMRLIQQCLREACP